MARIEAESFSDPWPASAFRDLLSAPAARLTVADVAGAVIGYTVVMAAADEAELANIAVQQDARGHGYGRLLLEAALAAARDDGVRAMFLEVRESNAAARALYSALGFAEVGRRKRYYVRPAEDALIMVWRTVEVAGR